MSRKTHARIGNSLALLFWVVAIASVSVALSIGIGKMQRVDCYTAQRYEAQFRDYQASPATFEKCIEQGINVFQYAR